MVQGAGWVYYWGMGLGGYRGGVIPVPSQLPEERSRYSGAGPVAPAGAEWVVSGARTHPAPRTTHSGPLVLRGPLRCPGHLLAANPASGPIRARLRSNYKNVSQNGQVSPKSVEKA